MSYNMRNILAAILMFWATGAQAEGQLNIYNWGNYTSPELIEKFEREFNVEVTITDYDSNDTALAKIRQGGHGFDIVVPLGPYCEKCGSSLTYGRTEEYDTTDRLLYISAATLDDPNRFAPTEVVWYSQRPEWFELVQTVPLHDGISPDQSDRAYNSAKQRQ